ncbi:MAG: ABC-type Fe3+ transport system substrate-binding protein [Paracoccaceae bacterium]|jgi:iron(III) transport system substrate-binding protein
MIWAMIHAMIWALLIMLLLAAPVRAQELTRVFGPADAPARIVLRSTTDLAVMAPVIARFLTTRPDLRLDYEQWGSNDLFALGVADCAAGRAGADLLISSAVHHMVRLVNDGCAAVHVSAHTRALPPALTWRDEIWGVTTEPVVMVYNRDLVPAWEVPRSRFDLLDLLRPEESRYHGRVATYDIETSGLGYLLAFADSLEATTFGGLMESFGRSGAVATCCSAQIIDAVINGEYLIAYNVLGSYAMARAATDPRLGVIAPSDYTLVLSRAAMIPKDAAARADAGAFVDFLLSDTGQLALREVLLILSLDAGDGGLVDLHQSIESFRRPIALSPALLIALDAHKRAIFLRRWRAAFPAP